jgi:hypothetical protein
LSTVLEIDCPGLIFPVAPSHPVIV